MGTRQQTAAGKDHRTRGENTAALTICGGSKTPLFLDADDLFALEVNEMVDISTSVEQGIPQGHIHLNRGIFLGRMLTKVGFAEHPDDSRLLVVASAENGRKAVFSWREIRRASAGSGVMIVRDDNSRATRGGRLNLLSTRDYQADGRQLPGLRTIEVLSIR